MIRPGEPWGSPTSSPPDIEVAGDDATLAAAIQAAPGALVRLRPNHANDLARAVGLRPGEPLGAAPTEVPVDALRFGDGSPDSFLGCNMCVVGVAPDHLRWTSSVVELEVLLDGKPWFSGPASTVVIANGQFLRGLDVVPRGHPGDGKAEVQVYELERRERRSMRSRLQTGSHVPHPRIRARSAGAVEVRCARPLGLEIDGVTRTPISDVHVAVVPAAFRLLV